MQAQRGILGDAIVDAALTSIRKDLAALDEAEASAAELQGERKLVTIVFADIAGFTAPAEAMDPETDFFYLTFLLYSS